MASRAKTTAARSARATKPKAAAPKPAGAAAPRPRKPAASKPKVAAVAPKPVATAPAPQVTERARFGDLLDAVADRSPLRRADVKAVMELMLEEMGKRVDAGEDLVLPPLGKLMVKKRVERPVGDMLTVKLKRPSEDETGS